METIFVISVFLYYLSIPVRLWRLEKSNESTDVTFWQIIQIVFIWGIKFQYGRCQRKINRSPRN